MNTGIEHLNRAGSAFVEFAGAMWLQSGILIVCLLLLDLVLRSKVRALFRYWIWMLVLAKLVLPPSLGAPTSLAWWVDLPTAPVVPAAPRADAPGDVVVEQAGPVEQIVVAGPSPATPAARQAARPAAVVAPLPALSWQAAALLANAVASLGLLLLLLQRSRFVSGLVRQSTAASDNLAAACERCRRRVGLRKAIEVRLSPNLVSPAVCGLRRPIILLPAFLPTQVSRGQMEAVLLHELVHIRRSDLWVNLFQSLVQIVYFYNPLLWLANAIIRRVREQAVDEAVLVTMGSQAQEYPETLLAVAKMALQRPSLSLRLVGVVESRSALTGRIRHILERPMPRTARLGIASAALLAVLAAALLPMARAAKAQPTATDMRTSPATSAPTPPVATHPAASQPDAGDNLVVLCLVDPAGKPMADAHVVPSMVYRDMQRGSGPTFGMPHLVTGTDGRATLSADLLFGHIPGNDPDATAPIYAFHETTQQVALVAIPRSARREQIEVRMHPACVVEGRLTSSQLAEAGRALGVITSQLRLKTHNPLQYFSENGRFEFALPPGRHRIIVSSPETLTIQRDIEIKPGQEELTVEIDLEAKPSALREPQASPADTAAEETEEAAADWEPRFHEVYRLEDNEVLKHIPPPFIPERAAYYRHSSPGQAEEIPRSPDMFQFHWNGQLKQYGMMFAGGRVTLVSALGAVGFERHEYDAPAGLLKARLPGDWIVRTTSDKQQRAAALEPILSKQLNRRIRITRRMVDRDVIVVRGEYQYQPLPEVGIQRFQSVHIYADILDADEGAGGGTASLADFLAHVGDHMNMPVIDETTADSQVVWRNHKSSRLRDMPPGPAKFAKVDQVLKNLARQTSLQFVRERRQMPVWYIEDASQPQGTSPATDGRSAPSPGQASPPAATAGTAAGPATPFAQTLAEYNALAAELDKDLAEYRASIPLFAKFSEAYINDILPLVVKGHKDAAAWAAEANKRGVRMTDFDTEKAQKAAYSILATIYKDVYPAFHKAFQSGQFSFGNEQGRINFQQVYGAMTVIGNDSLPRPFEQHNPYPDKETYEHWYFVGQLGQLALASSVTPRHAVEQLPPELKQKQQRVRDLHAVLVQQAKQAGPDVQAPEAYREPYLKKLEEAEARTGVFAERRSSQPTGG